MSKINPSILSAYEDYKNGMKNIELAQKYGVSDRTIRTWVKKYAWNSHSGNDNSFLLDNATPIDNTKENEILIEPSNDQNKLISEIHKLLNENDNLKDIEIQNLKNEVQNLKNEYNKLIIENQKLINENIELSNNLNQKELKEHNSRNAGRKSLASNEMIQDVLSLHVEGTTQSEIAKRFGVSVGTVNSIIKKSKIRQRKIK